VADRPGTSGGLAAGKEKERAAGAQINHGGRPTQASTTTTTITTGSGGLKPRPCGVVRRSSVREGILEGDWA